MDKQKLTGLIQHFPASSPEEAQELLGLKQQYPFSQVLHILAARAGKDHRWANHQNLLQEAAVYSTDRSVLKDIMTVETSVREAHETSATAVATPAYEASAPVAMLDSSIDLADQTLHDIDKLHSLMHDFEALVNGMESSEPAQTEKPKRSPGRPRKKKAEQNDSLIDELTSKEQIAPASEKTREQIQIIDQFIKTQPVLAPKTKAEPAETHDLASKSADFGDNIISETLVEILLRQGKKEKAIEILKKLIWKFPQKKAYFAAQIEELKK